MIPTLEKGRALVLAGPQGCGKTLKAREIARRHGTYKEVDVDVFDNHFELGAALSCAPATLIVDGLPSTAQTAAAIKAFITSDTVTCDRKGLEPKVVPAPNLIFCSGDVDALLLDSSDRRFHVVHLGGSGMNPNTGELRLLERGERTPHGFEPVPRGFLERVARDELQAAAADGRDTTHIGLRSRHPLAKWAAKVRAAKKRKAKLAAASRRRNRK